MAEKSEENTSPEQVTQQNIGNDTDHFLPDNEEVEWEASKPAFMDEPADKFLERKRKEREDIRTKYAAKSETKSETEVEENATASDDVPKSPFKTKFEKLTGTVQAVLNYVRK